MSIQGKNTDEELEINLIDLFRFFYSYRILIILVSVISAVVFGLYSFNLPDQYKSDTVVIPAESSSSNSSMGSLGGLASFAGVSVSDGPDSTQIALAVLNSRTFLVDFINENNIAPFLFSGDWNNETDSWNNLPPNKEDIAATFRGIISISNESDIYVISVDWIDSALAAKWANSLVQELNEHMQAQAIKEYEQNILFLKNQLEVNNLVGIENVLFKKIEEQTENIMIANVKNEYVFRILDPAIEASSPYKPKRLQIVFLGIFFGIFLGCVISIIHKYLLPRFSKQSL